jgi:aryl-alcohol dehydrogenase-like predicted oxidoreductase
MTSQKLFSRREMMAAAAGLGAVAALPFRAASAASAANGPVMTRSIPRTGERLPVIGIGTAIVFDIGDDAAKRAERRQVIQTLMDGGGRLIDTAPSYGSAEVVLGDLLSAAGAREKIFLATKVRVASPETSGQEMQQSLRRLRTDRVDLMQLHNVRDPKTDLGLLREWKAQGLCRYIGITSSFERDYDAVAAVLKRERPDFFQINYSLADRESEARLVPLAADVGAAVLTNLPFGRGKLFSAVRGKTLPEWASEFDASSWGQFSARF